MHKFTRFFAVMLAIAILLTTMGSVFAQEELCYGLSEADCDVYYSLFDNAEFADSGSMALNIDGTVTGAMPEPIEFNVLMTAAYVYDDDEAQVAKDAFGEVSALDLSLGDVIDLADGLVSSFDAELEIALSLPPEMGGDSFGPFSLWFVDGAGYADLTPIGMMSGDPSMEGVMGVDFFEFLRFPLGQVYMSDIFGEMDFDMGNEDFDPDEFIISDADKAELIEAIELFIDQWNAQWAAQMTEADLAEYMIVERLPDENIDGVDVVVFQTSIDFAAIFTSEALREQMIEQMEAQMAMQGEEPPSREEIDMIFDALGQSIAGSNIVAIDKVNLATGRAVESNATFDINIDTTPIMTMTGESAEMGQLIEIDLFMDVTSEINNVESIELPADAQLLPVEMLLGGF